MARFRKKFQEAGRFKILEECGRLWKIWDE